MTIALCEEIEIAQEFETCKEINERWPHLVEPHLASLHEDIQDRVRSKWRAHVGADRQRCEMEAMMARTQRNALLGSSDFRPFSLYNYPESQGFLRGVFGGLL